MSEEDILSSGSSGPTYLEIAAKKQTPGSEKTKPAPATSTGTIDKTKDGDDDSLPDSLEAAQEELKKLRKESKNAQKELGRKGKDQGDLRGEVARLQAEMDLLKAGKGQPEKKTERKSIREVVETHPAISGLKDEGKKQFVDLFDQVNKHIREEVDEENKALRQALGQQTTEVAKDRLRQQVLEAKEEVGEELLTAHAAEVNAFLQQHEYRFSVSEALKFVAPEEYVAAKAARREEEDKTELSTQGGLKRGKKNPPAPSKETKDLPDKTKYFMQVLEEESKKYG